MYKSLCTLAKTKKTINVCGCKIFKRICLHIDIKRCHKFQGLLYTQTSLFSSTKLFNITMLEYSWIISDNLINCIEMFAHFLRKDRINKLFFIELALISKLNNSAFLLDSFINLL